VVFLVGSKPSFGCTKFLTGISREWSARSSVGKSLGFGANSLQLDTAVQASRTSCHTISDIGIRHVHENPGYVRLLRPPKPFDLGLVEELDMGDEG
jgi:hypothetical protein